MRKHRQKIALACIIALLLNTSGMWTLAATSETFDNLKETSSEELTQANAGEEIETESVYESEEESQVNSGAEQNEQIEQDAADENGLINGEETWQEDENDNEESLENIEPENPADYESETETETEMETETESEYEKEVAETETEIETNKDETIETETSEVEIEENRETTETSDEEISIATASEIEDETIEETETVSEITAETEEEPASAIATESEITVNTVNAGDPDPSAIWAYWYVDDDNVLHYSLTQHTEFAKNGVCRNSDTLGGGPAESGTNRTSIVKISIDDDLVAGKGLGRWFSGYQNVTEIVGFNRVDFSNVENMHNLFTNCYSLRGKIDFSVENVSKVTDIHAFFRNCRELDEIDVTGFNIPNMQRGSYHFYATMFAHCHRLRTLDLSTWDLSGNIGDANGMFLDCTSLLNVKFGPYDNFKNTTNIREMFKDCISIASIDLNNVVTYVRDHKGSSDWLGMQNIFENCTNLRTIYVNSDNFVVTDKVRTDNMFANCPNLVGCNGTKWSSSKIDGTYARIDDDGTPGYFTADIRKITYWANGGSGTMPASYAGKNGKASVSNCTFTKQNSTFLNWTDLNNNTYKPGDEITLSGKLLLIAVWNTSGGGGGGGGGSGGGGGGGGGGGSSISPAGGILNPFNTKPDTTQSPTNKVILYVGNGAICSWTIDQITGKWRLTLVNEQGQTAPAVNGFYQLNTTRKTVVNNIEYQEMVSEIYYFDEQGNMVTGWVITPDGNKYFFNIEKTMDEGNMATGWKTIENNMYYFNIDGTLLRNGVTPDGRSVDAEGRLI